MYINFNQIFQDVSNLKKYLILAKSKITYAKFEIIHVQDYKIVMLVI